jgi:glucokinase
MSGFAVGVDLGGTKLLTALVTDRGTVLARERVATPQDGPPSVVAAIAETVSAVLRATGATPDQCRGIAVGAPGPLDPRTGVVYEPPNLPGWRNVPLADMLRSRLGMPAHVENDANAAALGEWWMGAGRGVRDLVYMVVGTGIGGGIISGDTLWQGVSGTAGEIGHTTIDVNGPRCGCGRPGHLEAMASGPAIARMAREAMAAGRTSVLRSLAGGDPARVTAATVAQAAAQGDAVAAEVFERAGFYIGVGVANLLNLLNPARVIIGGGVSRAGELLFAPVRRTVRALAFERPAADAEVVPAQLGDDVGAIGAAAVVFVRGNALPPRR